MIVHNDVITPHLYIGYIYTHGALYNHILRVSIFLGLCNFIQFTLSSMFGNITEKP